ncbi:MULTISPECIES: thiamine pyrophosphate-binding protein [Bacillaceae]|uniref:thiamine pyrophosphate-binding protein n=1 Tax=Bacillaceae TaxID=186817 RepID=UPI0015C75655|nr:MULTISPECIES: thiamine pyrophosphate-binding protein [Bacillaceae]MCM3704666.1 thiamine pyrophosphate-binding protein [Cytobacillus firmus]URM34796.1 thiamine pyrophosphate-binding protein [Cytobacillus firmus]
MRLTGSEIILEHLIQEEVPYIIGIPGHGILSFVDSFVKRKDKIKSIMPRHEQSSIHMADGYYRVKKKPLATYASIGPGAINTAVGLATSFVDSVPVFTVVGETHTHMFGRGVLQEIQKYNWANSVRVFEPITKKSWQATRVEQLPRIMNSAFNEMMTGRRGPVLLNLPMDVQADSIDVTLDDSRKRRVSDDYTEIMAIPGIEKAVNILLNAKRPVILAGGGIHASSAYEELKNLAEATGSAVLCTFSGKSAIEEDHSLYGWIAGSKGTHCGNSIAKEADVILAVGCRFADETTSSYRKGVSFNFPDTKLIHVDIDPHEIGKNYPVEIGIVGNAKDVLANMIRYIHENQLMKDWQDSDYYHEIQRKKNEWFAYMHKIQNDNRSPATISRFYKELREYLDRDAIVVTSSGNSQAQILQEFPFLAPGTNVTTGGFSTMGYAFPAALGAKLAAPDKQVCAVVGDGDFSMTLQELATAVQYNIPIVVIVLNNSGWQAITDLQISAFGKERIMATEFRMDNEGELYTPNFAQVAAGFGVHSQHISNPNEIKSALKNAFKQNGPSLIEITVNREYPYSGGISTGWWDVPVPTYLSDKRKVYEKEKAEESVL